MWHGKSSINYMVRKPLGEPGAQKLFRARFELATIKWDVYILYCLKQKWKII